MGDLFNEILHRPLVNLLVFLYERVTFNDLGLAIILVTLVTRVILFPVFHKTALHQRKQQILQPKLKKIQEETKDNKAAQGKAMMELYKAHGINPFEPFVLILIQLPILIALYQVFQEGFSEKALSSLYSFVPQPEIITSTFLGIDLSERNIAIIVLAALAQYIQGKLSITKPALKNNPTQTERIATQMTLIGPVITLAILWNFQAAIGLYWLSTTIFSIGHQLIVNRSVLKEGSI